MTQGLQGVSQAQLEQLLGNYKLTPATLMTKLDPSWIAAPWLQYLSFKVVEAVRRGNCGLCISAPPRHGKSTLITKAVPLWVMENFPDKSVVIATYGEELSTDFSRDIKDFITNSADKMSVRLRPDVRRVAHFENTQGGSIKAVGLKGTITGRGADVLIIDDYIKEPKEALSPTYLQGLWDWFTTVARTRLEPNAVVIMVATRWVPGDLHGRVESRQRETGRTFYEHIKIPAIWMPKDPTEVDMFGRKYGDPLFPERYSTEALQEIKSELTARWFNAMFQQDPQSDETMLANPDWFECVEWDHFVKVFHASPAYDWKATRGWDLASISNAGDYTSGPLVYYNTVTDETFFVDLVHGQFGPNRVEKEWMRADAADPLFIDYAMEREPGSSGVFTIEHFRGLLSEPRRRFVDYPTVTKKYLRAQPLLAAAENLGGPRKVFYVRAPWNQRFRDECLAFGTDDKKIPDDIMDGLAIAYNHLTGKKPAAGAWGRSTNDPTDMRNRGSNRRKGGVLRPKPEDIVQYAVKMGEQRMEMTETVRKAPSSGVVWGRNRKSH